MNKRIVVFGSISIDNTIYTSTLPEAGITVTGNSYFRNVGGKGANQACAAMFLGAKDVSFIGAVGKDDNGVYAKSFLKEQGLNCFLKESDEPTANAFIILDENTGENRIIILQGANNDINIEDVKKLEHLFTKGDIFLTQFENNLTTIEYLIKFAKEKGMTVVVNPAPAKKIKDETYQYIDYLIPNEHELETLSCCSLIKEGMEILLAKGCKNVIATLGEKGSALLNNKEYIEVAPHKVKAIDTTGAGDSYIGAFTYKLSIGASTKEAMEFASLCSSITVTRKGAIVSLPHQLDLK